MMSSLESAANLIEKTKPDQRIVVFVCGFGGAGKTTLCRELVRRLRRPSMVFEIDWYAKYATRERKVRIAQALASGDRLQIELEENPINWYDWKTLIEDLATLRSRGSVRITHAWNQATGEKDLSKVLQLPETPDTATICDGIYLLHEEIRDTADLRILLDIPIDLCLERAEQRDMHRSSRDYLDYKAALARKYDVPYFEAYSKHADFAIEI